MCANVKEEQLFGLVRKCVSCRTKRPPVENYSGNNVIGEFLVPAQCHTILPPCQLASLVYSRQLGQLEAGSFMEMMKVIPHNQQSTKVTRMVNDLSHTLSCHSPVETFTSHNIIYYCIL